MLSSAEEPVLEGSLWKVRSFENGDWVERDFKNKADADAFAVGKVGKMYEVNINADPEHFLDWDKPLSEQPASVQNALADVYRKRGFPIDDAGNPLIFSANPDGQSLHAYLASALQGKGNNSAGQAAASAMLREAGIPGIRYLDQGSRGAGNGTYNTVLFDDSLAKILGRE